MKNGVGCRAIFNITDQNFEEKYFGKGCETKIVPLIVKGRPFIVLYDQRSVLDPKSKERTLSNGEIVYGPHIYFRLADNGMVKDLTWNDLDVLQDADVERMRSIDESRGTPWPKRSVKEVA